MDQDRQKKQAALAALELLPSEGLIGLGTGSTTRYFIEGLAARVRAGQRYRGVPTSEQSRHLAEQLGIPLLDDEGPWDLDVCVDGADEVSATLDLIKGAGGAHTREKIVNFAARRNMIVVDESKLSQRLGERHVVPVEVLCFAHRESAAKLLRFGAATLRISGGAPFLTDSGNYLYDVRTGPIADPHQLDAELRTIPGVVETGLFCGRADVVIVARGDRVEQLVAARAAR
jgi:ribose 5-phosphate isomerase A